MELIIGVNTYVTVAEAVSLAETYLLDNDPVLIRFRELNDNDKSVLLYRGCLDMQKLPYRGNKKEQEQKLAFPRVNKLGYESDSDIVKLAQVINSLSFMSTNEVDDQAFTLLKNGISTFKLGTFSISFDQSRSGDAVSGTNVSNSGAVEKLLHEWLRGSVKIL